MTGETDRIERAIDAIREDLVSVREALAGLLAQFEMWKHANTQTQQEISTIRAELSKHQADDAAAQAELRAELRRLWWGVGIGLTAVAGAVVTLVAAGLT